MIELLDSIGARKAIWVGHDWGSPVVWSIAQHHPERCHGVANLCVPYIPEGFALATIMPLADRALYPEAEFPFAQWDYQIFYEENFERASSGFEADVRCDRQGALSRRRPRRTRQAGNHRGVRPRQRAVGSAPTTSRRTAPRDDRVIGRGGRGPLRRRARAQRISGPDSWYMNAEANIAYAERARPNWRPDRCRFCFCTARTTISARRSTRASPSRCAPIAPT